MGSTYKTLQNLWLQLRSSEQACRIWLYCETAKYRTINNHLAYTKEKHVIPHNEEKFRWKDEKPFQSHSKIPILAASIFGLGILKKKSSEADVDDHDLDPDIEEKMEIENR